MDEDKIDNAEDVNENNKSNEKTIEHVTTNDEASTSLLQPAGNEKLASEYEQFMKMVCTTTDVTKEYSPKKNPVKSTSPHSYHEFNIESNFAEDNTNMEILLKEKFDKTDKPQVLEGSIKSTECEESTLSTDCQIQANENNTQIKHTNENDKSEDSKSIPSDWENVRIKVERLSDENTESREVKKKKKKATSSSDSSNSTISSDSEKEKKKRKRKRKVLGDSSSSDSDSTDSSSSSSDSSSSEERRKRKRKKKKVGKKRKKAKRTARIKKKRRRKMSTDSNSSDSDEHTKKKKTKKKSMEAKSINNGDISKIISKSPVIASSSDGTKILQSATSAKKIKEETADEDRNRSNQVISTKKNIVDMSDNECLKQKKERKESKSDESFIEQWEMDSMIMQQNDGETSSQDYTEKLEKMDSLEKGKYRRKRKHSRDNIEQDKDRSFKVNEERIHEGKARSDEEVEAKRKKRREKDINKSSAEFLANWERENEHITQQIQNEAKYLKKLGKQKKEKWGETDFDTLNVPSLTQLEKEVYQKHLLVDEWEVDSLEAISDSIMNKRKSSQSSLKKIEKEVRYDKKTDTYIAIEKESIREMKKKQERLCAIRIWEEEQEEGEREEMMLLEQKSKRKTDDWDIEEESLFHKTTEEVEVCKINDTVAIEKEWAKTDEEKDSKEDTNKLTMKPGKRVKKSRWDMGSQSEKPEAKDIWEEEHTEWSKINKCEQEFEKTKKRELHSIDYSESSSKSDLIDLCHRKLQSKESLERSWTSEEVAIRPVQAKKDTLIKHSISAKTNEEQLVSVKEHQRDQFKEISKSNVKFQEKTVELYSPSSPALSQKSQVGIFYLLVKKWSFITFSF